MTLTNDESRPRARGGSPSDQAGGRVSARVTAVATVHLPSGRRRQVWAAYICPSCSASHFARAATVDALTGVRRSGCGRTIRLVAGSFHGGAL